MWLLALSMAPAASQAQWAAGPGETVRNEFGPDLGIGAAMCRGACGGDCNPNNCFEEDPRKECVSPTEYVVVRTYNCGTHAGCREHDDCLDRCSERYPGSTFEENFYVSSCARSCHEACLPAWKTSCAIWAGGYSSPAHPYDGRTRFEYTKATPHAEEPRYRCPEGMRLACYASGAVCYSGPPPPPPPVSITIGPAARCLEPGDELEMWAAVLGTDDSDVDWTVVSGPGRFETGTSRLVGTGTGDIIVRATSTAAPDVSDTTLVQVGTCECYFRARLTGDPPRVFVEGKSAVWSRPAQDAAAVAGPLLRSLGGMGMLEDAVGAGSGEVESVLDEMEQVGSFVLKLDEGSEDVNSFALTLHSESGATTASEVGATLHVDGFLFLVTGEMQVRSAGDGWLEGTLTGRGEGTDERGLVPGPAAGPYEVEIAVDFRAGNPLKGAFCAPVHD